MSNTPRKEEELNLTIKKPQVCISPPYHSAERRAELHAIDPGTLGRQASLRRANPWPGVCPLWDPASIPGSDGSGDEGG
jgi:hypothetical protein